jgi:sulfur carrier protein
LVDWESVPVSQCTNLPIYQLTDSEMIRVNNKFDVEWQEGMTVNSILEVLKFTFPMIVVSVNGKVIPRSEYGTTTIEDNDQVRVIHLVAGG